MQTIPNNTLIRCEAGCQYIPDVTQEQARNELIRRGYVATTGIIKQTIWTKGN